MSYILIASANPELRSRIRRPRAVPLERLEWAESDLDAYRRIVSLPTIGFLIIDVDIGTGLTGSEIAHFGKQVLPGASVFFVTDRDERPVPKAYGICEHEFADRMLLAHEVVGAIEADLSCTDD